MTARHPSKIDALTGERTVYHYDELGNFLGVKAGTPPLATWALVTAPSASPTPDA